MTLIIFIRSALPASEFRFGTAISRLTIAAAGRLIKKVKLISHALIGLYPNAKRGECTLFLICTAFPAIRALLIIPAELIIVSSTMKLKKVSVSARSLANYGAKSPPDMQATELLRLTTL